MRCCSPQQKESSGAVRRCAISADVQRNSHVGLACEVSAKHVISQLIHSRLMPLQYWPMTKRIRLPKPNCNRLSTEPACLPARLPACPPARLLACPPARLPACPPARLPACPPAHLPACPPARLPDCSPVRLLA